MNNPNDSANKPPEPPASSTAIAPSKARGTSGIVLALIILVGIGLGAVVYFSPKFLIKENQPAKYTALKVGGTSVIASIAENYWKTTYRKERGIDLDYDSTGSTNGVNNLIDGKFAIAFTHAPLTEEQRKKAEAKGPILHIPVLLCGVAPIYNVKELKNKPPVKFTGEVLADIYLGKITKWDDKALQALNPELMLLPSTPIQVIHREDSSGTTYLLAEFLHATSKAWREKYDHPSSEIKWAVGIGASRNLGIVTKVYQTEGAIGYVDRVFTTYDAMELNYGAVKNENKEKPTFVRAEPENMLAALHGALPEIREDLTFNLANKPGANAYPISGVVYAICYQNQPEAQKLQVKEFLHWIAHEGQDWIKQSTNAPPLPEVLMVKRTTYAPLPPELLTRVDQRIELIEAAP